MKLHHIGYATDDILSSAEAFKIFGFFPTSSISCDEERGVDIQFLSNEQGFLIELVAPNTPSSPVSRRLKKERTSHPYHLCFESQDIASDIRNFAGGGYVQVTPLSAACAIENRRVVFLLNREMGLVELVEA